MRRISSLALALSACASSLGPGSSAPLPQPPHEDSTLPIAASWGDREDGALHPSDGAAGGSASAESGAPPDPAPPAVYPFHQPLPPASELMKGSASRLANLSSAACQKRIRDEKLPFKRSGPLANVATPLRFQGALGEVTFRVPPEKTPWGIIDCRMALALWEILPILRAHEVKAVRIDNFYRPRAKLGRGKKSQHAYALAADVVSITLDDGREIDVERDFHGQLGQPVCGPDAFLDPVTDEAVRMRNLVCELARVGAFHHMLTPNHDRAHVNHLHVDIKRDNRWFSVD